MQAKDKCVELLTRHRSYVLRLALVQRNRPWCSRPAHSQMPMPSCTRTFIRLARRLANRSAWWGRGAEHRRDPRQRRSVPAPCRSARSPAKQSMRIKAATRTAWLRMMMPTPLASAPQRWRRLYSGLYFLMKPLEVAQLLGQLRPGAVQSRWLNNTDLRPMRHGRVGVTVTV